MTARQAALEEAINGTGLVNIGQLSRSEVAALEGRARKGLIFKYRGYWNTKSADVGMGPLKTIYRAVV